LLGHVSISPPFTKNKVTFLYPRISTWKKKKVFSSKSTLSQLFLKRPQDEELAEKDQYDGRKRDPSYAHADKSCLWELVSTLWSRARRDQRER
jgi:hypothetical protein